MTQSGFWERTKVNVSLFCFYISTFSPCCPRAMAALHAVVTIYAARGHFLRNEPSGEAGGSEGGGGIAHCVIFPGRPS